jgi:hypothetical protein
MAESTRSFRAIDLQQQLRPRPAQSNPHSTGRTALRSPIAVSSLGRFRTPAACVCDFGRPWPASETLHKRRHGQRG